MPLDAICLQAVVQELKPILIGQRIDKVQMPARDQAVLTLRAGRLLRSRWKLHSGLCSDGARSRYGRAGIPDSRRQGQQRRRRPGRGEAAA